MICDHGSVMFKNMNYQKRALSGISFLTMELAP